MVKCSFRYSLTRVVFFYRVLLLSVFILKAIVGLSQTDTVMRWLNPASCTFPVIEGRFWHTDLANFYDRLPSKAKKMVRSDVWQLGQNTAGEYIKFKTNASEIVVRYMVWGPHDMPHMPATGVSGIDLYALDQNKNWNWAAGTYSFGDTIEYKFINIKNPSLMKEFRLYLPLYNTPIWTHIGVANNAAFEFLPVTSERPLVIYGTSILQGACASRPGLAWSNVLGRKLNMPIINFGFSGNGQLEPPVIKLMNEMQAALYVLDCMPNLYDSKKFSDLEVQLRIRDAVNQLRSIHAMTPILLAEHCCGLPAVNLDTVMVKRYERASNLLNQTFTAMRNTGIKKIFLLSDSDIGFDSESTVDGTHPNDRGMLQYADAYEKMIRRVLNKK